MSRLALSRRFLQVAAVVSLGVVAAGIALLWDHDRRITAAVSEDQLDSARAAQRLVEAQTLQDLALRAELIAGNQAVVAYLSQALEGGLPGMESDTTSVVDLLEERRVQLDLALIAVVDGAGNLVAATDPTLPQDAFARAPAIAQARAQQTAQQGLFQERGRMLGLAIQPLAAYTSGDAYLVVAAPVGDAFARAVAEVGHVDVVLVGRDGVPVASTLPQASARVFAARATPPGARGEGRATVDAGSGQRSVLSAPLFGDVNASALLVAQPVAEAGSYAAARRPLRIGLALGLAAMVMGLYLLWSRLIAPLQSLAEVVEYAADSGDFHLRTSPGGASLVVRLTDAFNRLCVRARSASRGA